jgi:hypothetical protein
MKNVVIPKKEKKTKRLFVPITPTEQLQITGFCKMHQIKISDFIRFAIKQTYELF